MKVRTAIRIMLSLCLYGFNSGAEIPEKVLEKSVSGGLNLTQAGFNNWSAGGEGSFALQMNLNYRFIHNLEKVTWSNTGSFAYGALKTGDKDSQKSVDEIKLESVITYKLGSAINPFIAMTGETQFSAGYDYSIDPASQISAFMDPGYFRESFGAGIIIREGLSTRLGLSFKQSVTTDFPKPYADDLETPEIEKLRNEFGAESVSDIILTVSGNTEFVSKLELFSAFSALDETDVKWDNTLTVKVSNYINVNMNMKLVYDKDISAKRQIRQALALGLNYTFI